MAHELESHISGFAQRVEQRRRLLELSVLFYSHTDEVRVEIFFIHFRSSTSFERFLRFSFQLSNWLGELKQELQSEEVAESLEGAERLLEQFSTQRDSTLDACASTIAEGKTLLEELKYAVLRNSVARKFLNSLRKFW